MQSHVQGTEYHNALLRCIRERVYRYWKKCIQHEEYKSHFKQTVKNFGWGFHWHSSLHWTELACILPLLQGDLEALSVLFSPFSFLAFCYFNLYADWDVVGLWLGSAVIELTGWLNFFFLLFYLRNLAMLRMVGKSWSPWAQNLSPRRQVKQTSPCFLFEASPMAQGVSILSFTETAVQEDKVKTIDSLA